MSRVTIEISDLKIPTILNVGDEIDVELRARIVRIEEEVLDVTPIGGPTRFIAGERSYKLLAVHAEVVQ